MRQITPQVTNLFHALQKRGVDCEIEEWDGHKHVDISIPKSYIDIEVNGLTHYIDPETMVRDLNRMYWSFKNDRFLTLHIPNMIVDQHLEQLADSIAYAAQLKKEEHKKRNNVWWKKILRAVLE